MRTLKGTHGSAICLVQLLSCSFSLVSARQAMAKCRDAVIDLTLSDSDEYSDSKATYLKKTKVESRYVNLCDVP